jgi:hypothetical protein
MGITQRDFRFQKAVITSHHGENFRSYIIACCGQPSDEDTRFSGAVALSCGKWEQKPCYKTEIREGY